MNKNWVILIILLLICVNLEGCSTVPVQPEECPQKIIPQELLRIEKRNYLEDFKKVWES